MSERTIDTDDIRREHAGAADQAAHWAYLAGVVLVGLLVMLAFIAFLGGTAPPG